VAGCAHHIVQRGNNRQDLFFFVDDDRRVYLELLAEQAARYGLAIEGDCLMRTHTGRPLGSDAFLSKLETLLGRRVRPLPVGRPRQAKPQPDQGRTRDRHR
jgi:putative transposase